MAKRVIHKSRGSYLGSTSMVVMVCPLVLWRYEVRRFSRRWKDVTCKKCLRAKGR